MLAKTEWPSDYQEQFWEQYPRRIAKKAAMKALDKVHKANEVPFEVLISAVKVYARSVVGKDMKYVAHPASWINSGRWDDEPEALVWGKVSAARAAQMATTIIKRDTPQAKAWESYRGRPIPWGNAGIWQVESEWPPGWVK